MRTKALILIFVICISLLAGCGTQSNQNAATTTPQTTAPTTGTATAPATTGPDAKTSASVVDNAAAFEKAISGSGTWIIAITKDLTIDKAVSLDGEFKNGKKDTSGKDIVQRKLALYAQDANRNITARYTLTAPKFTINSPEASFQHGTFKGDVYVAAKDFQLIDAKVDGNVYFTTDIAKSTFKLDSKSSVTGKQELKK